mmetsp:Transcript_84866/g.127238  ORF Transcript_84866/g.127238 Transcript_84866/m.127238 type:complete len:105 (-) Transcript_84866:7-321(-)
MLDALQACASLNVYDDIIHSMRVRQFHMAPLVSDRAAALQVVGHPQSNAEAYKKNKEKEELEVGEDDSSRKGNSNRIGNVIVIFCFVGLSNEQRMQKGRAWQVV